MSLAEAARHVERIRRDPSSALAAEMEGWDYPVSRTEALLMDLWDVAAPHTYKKPKPDPRPWKVSAEVKRHGNAAGRTPEQVKALLREHFGHPAGPV
jgi:hypothetical protein